MTELIFRQCWNLITPEGAASAAPPIAQEADPHAAVDTCQKAEAAIKH